MGMTRAIGSALDRAVQFQRATETTDGFGGSSLSWSDLGEVIPALRTDVSDTEAVQAGVFRERSLIRFQVRSTAFTRSITAADRVEHEGATFAIVGIKEPQRGQRRQLLEITCEGPVP